MGFLFRPALLLSLALSTGPLHGEGLDTLVGQFHASRGNLPAHTIPWDAINFQREEDLITAWEKRLESLDYDSLDVASRIDWHLMATELRDLHANSQSIRIQSEKVDPILAFSKPIRELLLLRTRRKSPDPIKAGVALQSAATALKEIRKRLEDGKIDPPAPGGIRPTKLIALRAGNAVDQIRSDLKSWFAFYNYGPLNGFAGWARDPCQTLAAEMASLAGYLRKEIAGIQDGPDAALMGIPIGAEGIRTALRKEMIPYSAEELIAIAGKELSWCEAEMKKATGDLGCATRDEALEKIRSDHPPFGHRKAAVVAAAEEAIRFLKQKDLVTIPPLAESNWGVGMSGREMLETIPYISYRQPRLMVPYINESMPQDEMAAVMRANNTAFLHTVTPHELIPGHHLQAFMADRYALHRAPFSTAFLVEGWAIHWETLLWDQGYLDTPSEKVGALFWRMHRSARVIVSLKFHLGEMTPSEMVDFLVNRVGNEPAAATAEVRRYTTGGYGPLYQVAYTIGGLQITTLQKELTAPGPGNEGARGTLTLREFHDQILRLGPIPIELIRASLKKESLPKDWRPAWRFAG